MKSVLAKTKPSPPIHLRKAVFGVSASRRWLIWSAILGLLGWSAGVVNANILFNGNLDDISISSQNNPSPTGWIVDASKTISGTFYDGADSETWCNVAADGGYGVFFKPFQGDQSVGDLLTVYFYQDNPATPGTKYTLSGYAAGEANYCGFFATNSPAPQTLFVVEFLDIYSTILASNALDLVTAGLPSSGAGSMAQFTTPEFTAPANTVTVRVGASMINAYSTTGAQSFFVDAFDLESVAPPGSPIITNQPAQTTVAPGATATLTVGVSNPTGVTYQWQHANTALVNGGNISGADQSTLTITDVSTNDVGHYRVLVSNSAGSVYSDDATLTMVGINFFPTISLGGKIGDTYRVDYSTAVAPTTWIPLSTNKLTTSPQLIIDTSSPQDNTRFYRAVFLH